MNETPQERREAAATRRRWITLAEVVAVASVLIAALTLYLTWTDKRDERAQAAAEKAEQQAETKAAAVVTLRATAEDGGKRLALADPAHPVDSVDITFPTALGVSPQESLLKPAIEADWVKSEMLKLTDGGKDRASGRLPVLIASTFWEGDVKRTDRAIYDVVWRTEAGGIFGGRAFKLDGMVLRQRSGDLKRLDAIWQQTAPAPKS